MILRLIFLFGLFVSLNSKAQQSLKFNDNMSIATEQPPYIKAGDTIAIVAPSGILLGRDGEVQQAKKLLESWGLYVVVGRNVFKKNNHFAGTDSERLADLQWAMNDPSISGIWCARGGYGTVRILDGLDFKELKKNPKWIIGYSDITALHNELNNQGIQSLHALMCVSLTKNLDEIKPSIETFKSALFGKPVNYTLKGSKYNREGFAKGQLVGGNLTILHTMLGSNSSIDTKGKILFIEEIGEYKYHIDRMLQSLKRAGYFDNCAGLVVGDMSKMRKNTTAWGSSVEQLILDALKDYDFPIAFNMPAGHEKDNRALVLGTTVELKVEKDRSLLIYRD